MAEWLKAPVSKTGISGNRDRGFESRPLRHSNIDTSCSEYISIDSKRAHCQPNKWRYKTILERCRSGLTGTPGKRVWGNSPQVRILSSPPHPIYKNYTPLHPTHTQPTPPRHTGLYPSFPRRRETTGWGVTRVNKSKPTDQIPLSLDGRGIKGEGENDATHRHVIADLIRPFIGTRMMKNEVLLR